MHMLLTPKNKNFFSVSMCEAVWFRDVLLWYNCGWIPVLVVLKNSFTNTADKNS